MRPTVHAGLGVRRLNLLARLSVAFSVALLLSLSPALGAATNAPDDLSGSWKRADDFSQDPNARPDPGAGEGQGGQGRQGRGGGRGPGAGGGQGGGRGAGGGSRGRQGGRLPLRGGAEAISIAHSEPTVETRYADGTTRTIFTSKKSRKLAGPEGLLADVGKWKGEVLVVKSRTERAKLKEKFELSDEGDRLWLTTTLAVDGRPKVTFLQTYIRGIVLDFESRARRGGGSG